MLGGQSQHNKCSHNCSHNQQKKCLQILKKFPLTSSIVNEGANSEWLTQLYFQQHPTQMYHQRRGKDKKGLRPCPALSSLVQPCPALSSLVQPCPALSSLVQLCPVLLARDKSCAFRSLAVISCLWSLTEYLKEQPREWEQIFRSDRINWSSCSHWEWSEYKRGRRKIASVMRRRYIRIPKWSLSRNNCRKLRRDWGENWGGDWEAFRRQL